MGSRGDRRSTASGLSTLLVVATLFAESCAWLRGAPDPTAAAAKPVSPKAILESDDLPVLRARSGKTNIPVARGSLCWSRGGTGVCADAIAPPELVRTVRPAEVRPGATVRLELTPLPLEESLLVNRWVDGRPVRVALTDPATFPVPDEPGTYVYDVFARWPRGDVSWAFSVKVKTGEKRASP